MRRQPPRRALGHGLSCDSWASFFFVSWWVERIWTVRNFSSQGYLLQLTSNSRERGARSRAPHARMLVAWSWLLASATGLRGPIPTTRTRQVCIARAGPAIALFGKSRGNDLVLRELDTLKPTLSYQGWQRDVAEVESDYTKYSGSRIPASTLAKVRKKQQLHDGVNPVQCYRPKKL